MKSNSPVTPCLADQLITLLEEVKTRRAAIEAALAHAAGTHSFDDIVQMIMTGRLRWWALPTGFMLTEVMSYPQTRHFHVFLAGGDLQEIYDEHPKLVEAAMLEGCSKLTLGGRRGWTKALAHLGWKEHCTVAALDLSREHH